MSGLSDNTTFYVRAYATNSAGTGYGATLSFTTFPSCTLPTVTTSSITAILATSATGGGNVTATGGCAVTARGVCWSTSTNPTISNSHTTDGSGTGSFTSNITGLTPNTTYYVRAYATNSAGDTYTTAQSFTTLPSSCTPPTVRLSSISGITATTANTALIITSTGGCSVLVSTIRWSVNSDFSGAVSSGPNTTGSYTITGLSPNTTYYVRGYAANSAGDTYTATQSFTTLPSCTLPTVTTVSITNITITTASGGGSVTSDGGCTVTARGVQYSLYPDFSVIAGSTTSGNGTGTFSVELTGLLENTTYYIRAFAQNAIGVAYGSILSFKSLATETLLCDEAMSRSGGYATEPITYNVHFGDHAGLYVLEFQNRNIADLISVKQNGTLRATTGSPVNSGSYPVFGFGYVRLPLRFIYNPENGKNGQISVSTPSDETVWAFKQNCPVFNQPGTAYSIISRNYSLAYDELDLNTTYNILIERISSGGGLLSVNVISTITYNSLLATTPAAYPATISFNTGSTGGQVIIDLLHVKEHDDWRITLTKQ